MKKKSTGGMLKLEKSSLDKKIDKITAFKEGLKKDKALDKAILKTPSKKK